MTRPMVPPCLSSAVSSAAAVDVERAPLLPSHRAPMEAKSNSEDEEGEKGGGCRLSQSGKP